jgi:hypothetical protein
LRKHVGEGQIDAAFLDPPDRPFGVVSGAGPVASVFSAGEKTATCLPS